MLDRLFKRKRGTVSVNTIMYPEHLTEFFVPHKTLWELAKNRVVYETQRESYVFIGENVYRSLKPNAKPRIIQTDHIYICADYSKVQAQVSKETLFQYANEYGLMLFETPESYILPSKIMMVAKKA